MDLRYFASFWLFSWVVYSNINAVVEGGNARRVVRYVLISRSTAPRTVNQKVWWHLHSDESIDFSVVCWATTYSGILLGVVDAVMANLAV